MTTFRPYENETAEFKRELTDTLEKEVVAFLNSAKGGDIYIGVEDDGTVVGVQTPDKLQLAIIDRIRNNILPTTLGFFDVVTQEIQGQDRHSHHCCPWDRETLLSQKIWAITSWNSYPRGHGYPAVDHRDD